MKRKSQVSSLKSQAPRVRIANNYQSAKVQKHANVLICTICILANLHLFVICTTAQSKIDSLLSLLKTDKEDTNKVNHLNDLSWRLRSIGEYEKAMQYANDALQMFKRVQSLGKLFIKGKAAAYNNIGAIYYAQGDYDKALEDYFASLKIREQTGDKKGIASCYNNIGGIYWEKGDYDNALNSHLASLKIRGEIGDRLGMAASYNNIGIIYDEHGNYDKALENYSSSLKIKEELGDKMGIGATYNNIAATHEAQHNLGKALENHFASLKIREELGDKQGIAESYNNIAKIYLKQNKTEEAKKQSLVSLCIAKEIFSRDDIKQAYSTLALCYSSSGDWKNAYEHHRLYSEMKDSILNEESSKQIAEMQTKYETEKKEQQITLLNKDKELQDAHLNRQKIVIWSVVSGLLLVVLLSVFIFRERKKSEKLLLNILPAETARELKTNGKATARHYESVTVMFTDFKGFTAIAEKLSAEELVSELDFIFKKFDEIISGYPIEKIKTIGDAYMCAGGLPTANTTNAMDVTLAALEIQDFMRSHNARQTSENKPVFEIRIGIHTGPIVAGIVGIKKFAYDIWGDTVNTASRMESSGDAGKVNISGTTHKYLSETKQQTTSLKFAYRGKVQVKNKKDIEMFFVERSGAPSGSIPQSGVERA